MAREQRAMEVLGLTMFENIYQGKQVLVTGHTRFKGSWLTLWLTELGAQVTGLTVPKETQPNSLSYS
jgi:CDP-glucose 4,6-dehydratase